MAIHVRLDDLLYERRMTLTELADRIGITIANLSILKTGKARAIRFSTLEAICQALSCQPGDLLHYQPDLPLRPRAEPLGPGPDDEALPGEDERQHRHATRARELER